MVNLAAWTGKDSVYPPFISINKDDDGIISITVREESLNGVCGKTISVKMDVSDFVTVLSNSTYFLLRNT